MSEEDTTMKKIDPSDPRFTAKALGDESWEPLETLSIDDADRGEFEELQAFAAELKSGYARSAAANAEAALGAARLQAIRAAVQRAPRSKLLSFPAWIATLAATFALGGIALLLFVESNGTFHARTEDLPSRKPALERIRVDTAPAEAVGDSAPESTVTSGALSSGAAAPTGLSDLRNKFARPSDMAMPGVTAADLLEPRSAPYGEGRERMNRSALEIDDRRSARRTMIEHRNRLLSAAPTAEPFSRDGYAAIEENAFKSPLDHPLSTFSIDVDTASYANVRRFIESGARPPADAVRVEELVNYFRYAYPEPNDGRPFSVTLEAAAAPWKPASRLVRIGLRGATVSAADRPAANLVFLIDVSGSMDSPDKLPLAKRALSLLVGSMGERDRIAVVIYAGASGLALPSTTANNAETIRHAIERLQPGGSTNGAAGIELAYQTAKRHFVEGGINRVILCTDGDFNVGATDQGSLVRLIEEQAKSGVYFSAIGFGRGDYRDDTMELLSNKGNGNYAYLDSEREARKVFVDDLLGTLHSIAKDVKIQVEFNPAKVAAYRLVGYENRALAKEDFNDDAKDAGEIGAGHAVTALYEVVPAGQETSLPSVDPLKYQRPARAAASEGASEELLTVKLRYKLPDADASQLLEYPLSDDGRPFESASADLRFAASVAAFGMLLRDSEYAAQATFARVRAWAESARADDPGGLRADFVELVEKAERLTAKE